MYSLRAILLAGALAAALSCALGHWSGLGAHICRSRFAPTTRSRFPRGALAYSARLWLGLAERILAGHWQIWNARLGDWLRGRSGCLDNTDRKQLGWNHPCPRANRPTTATASDRQTSGGRSRSLRLSSR